MEDGLRTDAKLMEEYESSFDNEERVQNSLKLDKGSFSITVGVVDFDTVSFPENIKKARKETYLGLSTSIGELGILTPIHVMVLEGFADYMEEGGKEEDYEGFRYVIVDGFRRFFSGVRNGLTRCNAVIWDFEDKEKGSELLTTLSLVLNKIQKHSWSEVWYLYGILELQSSLSPSTLEYLLQLEAGDAMKLKDIMLCDYPDVIEELLANKKSLTQCYNMLQKYRKEEDKLLNDDNKGISDVEQAEDIVDKGSDTVLSNEDVKDLLEMGENFDGELSDEAFDSLMGNDVDVDRQTVGDRHPLDPKLRAAVLQRDNYECQVTGFGKGLPAEVALAVLQVHHKVPVHAGGTDEMVNLITVSQDPHTLIHVIERRGGRLGISKEDFDALPERTQDELKNIMKVARFAVEANKKLGRTKDQIKKDTSAIMKYDMPGKILKENMDAVKGL